MNVADPCVTKINQTSFLMASNKLYIESSTWKNPFYGNSTVVLLYDFASDNWSDVSKGFPCEVSDDRGLKCAKSDDFHIAIVSANEFCTAILNLIDLTWSETRLTTDRQNQGFAVFNANDEVILFNGNNVYKLKQLKWIFQSQMKTSFNGSTFVTQSK